jgi:hypothetical protein
MKVISFSLFGEPSIYTFGAVVNAYRIGREVFPGWIARFYFTNTVASETRELLRYFGAQLVYVQPGDVPSPIFGRMLVMTGPDVEAWICREAEARVGGLREEAVVAEWLKSKVPWHVIKDHPGCAVTPVSTGCWGGRGLCAHLPNLKWSMLDWASRQAKPVLWTERKPEWFIRNQEFVRDCLWPRMLETGLMVHWSEGAKIANQPYSHYADTLRVARSFPPELEDGSYIGEAIGYQGAPVCARLREARKVVNGKLVCQD